MAAASCSTVTGYCGGLHLEPEVTLQKVPIQALPSINNDHVLDAETRPDLSVRK